MLTLLLAALGACAGGNARQAAAADKPEAARPAVEFSADSAYAHVKAQVDAGPRVPGMPGHAATARYIREQLGRYGADTVLTQQATVTAFNGDRLPIVNIMGRYNPSAQARLLLVAHWDTRPWADAEEDASLHGRPIPGANDGASGVGVLLEIARQLGLKRPAVGVDLLFVDAEDYGESGGADESSWCLGSQHWVTDMPYSASDRPRYGVLLDMVGGVDARFHRELISDHVARPVVDRVWATAREAGYGDIFVNSAGTAVIDDHLFISRAGIPVIDIIDAVNPATGTFPSTWHTMADDMSSISATTLKAVGQTVTNLIYKEKP